jgi:two-component system sensor histidine kinase PilS (NtrC family)
MPQASLRDIVYLRPLARAFFTWRKAKHETTFTRLDPVAFVNIKPREEGGATTIMRREHTPPLGRHLKLRFSSVMTDSLQQELSLIFLQDVAKIDERAQQLKLAAMGRLTASIAHEVRNPLAAIGHASALLEEEIEVPAQQRLLKIVSDNVSRLNRMVEDILNLSRKVQTQEPIPLAETLVELKTSFDEMHRLSTDFLHLDIPAHYRVRFDPAHLREVMLNLWNNALRYASGQPSSLRVYTVHAAPNRLELHVQDDGPPITPQVRAHLFEPFYTTSRQGTGLGLYLARELCSNNGAMLDYEVHPDLTDPNKSSGRFVITFAAADMNEKGLSP